MIPTERGNRAGGWLRTLLVFLAALAVYAGSAQIVQRFRPGQAYFPALAAAFLDGRLHLANPRDVHDLTEHNGRWYVPFPPLPALLMLPWVAFAGAKATNPVWFSIVFSAVSVAAVDRLLHELARRGWIALRGGGRLWLTALFAVGCVNWYVSLHGAVWQMGQVCTLVFIALAAWLAAAYASPWPTATALALALLGRPNVIFIWPLLAGIAAQRFRDAEGRLDRGRWLRWCACSCVPLALSVGALLWYNRARFENPLDFGYARQNVDVSLRERIAHHGLFSLHYVPTNARVMFAGLPKWQPQRPWLRPDDVGMSIFLTTPALVYLVLARRRDPLTLGAWLAAGLLLAPLLTYYNTGWMQFGYRFLLDLILPLVVLLAIAARQRVSWLMRTLILLGVVVNAWGVLWTFTPWLGE